MAQTRLNPYLNFRGTAREAMDFYRSVFGGELTRTTFAEGGVPHDPAERDQIMHSQLETDGGLTLMASDVPSSMNLNAGNNFSVSLSGDDEAELRGFWDKLSEGASVTTPLDRAPWGDSFGMLVDRYGVNWLVNIAGQPG
jgi:PhnB protein